MLHDLANDDGYVALKLAAEDREGWRHRERMSRTCSTAEQTTDDDHSKCWLSQHIIIISAAVTNNKC